MARQALLLSSKSLINIRIQSRETISNLRVSSLHNIAKVSSSDPLLVYLPPYSTAFTAKPAQLPVFMQRQPTAVINYRWAGFTAFEAEDLLTQSRADEEEDTHLSWPAPIHDAAKAYDWIVENLGPSTYTRRDIYLYGSYLGASLATSLALTETHPHARTGVRGCVAYNGIYNWTMFLPDHPAHRLPRLRSALRVLEEILSRPDDPAFRELRRRAEALFRRPDNLFDPFASPCLFFHTPGLLVPPSFDASAFIPPTTSLAGLSMLAAEDEAHAAEALAVAKPPRKSALVFPPRKSTLKIPETLLLHSTPPPLPPSLLRRRQRRKKEYLGNSFAAQAEELAALMRRSVDKVELKERAKWDDDPEGNWHGEAARRIQVADTGGLGGSTGDFGLDGGGEEVAAAWLEDRIAHAR